jgi:hypothetical protein
MSSVASDWVCTQCNSVNGYFEHFEDSEVGHISECKDCKFMEVYREDAETGKLIEDYAGYEHYYNKEKKNMKIYDITMSTSTAYKNSHRGNE